MVTDLHPSITIVGEFYYIVGYLKVFFMYTVKIWSVCQHSRMITELQYGCTRYKHHEVYRMQSDRSLFIIYVDNVT